MLRKIVAFIYRTRFLRWPTAYMTLFSRVRRRILRLYYNITIVPSRCRRVTTFTGHTHVHDLSLITNTFFSSAVSQRAFCKRCRVSLLNTSICTHTVCPAQTPYAMIIMGAPQNPRRRVTAQ